MLHLVLREVDSGVTIATKSVQICVYADDETIIARNIEELKDVFLRTVRMTDRTKK